MADQMKFRITPKQIEAARTRLAEAGFSITGESGAIEKDGYRIGYSLGGGVLSLQVLAQPRFVPMPVVDSRIRTAPNVEGLRNLT